MDISTPNVLNEQVTTAENAIKEKGLKVKIMGSGTTVVKQVPVQGESIPQNGTVVLYTDEASSSQTTTVPNIVGLSVSDANAALINAGLNIRLSGTGFENSGSVCFRQDIQEGQQVEYGTIIKAEFRVDVADDAA